jgi:hypothetical protein
MWCDPDWGWKVPLGHNIGLMLPEGQYWPGGHSTQEDCWYWYGLSEYVPCGHLMIWDGPSGQNPFLHRLEQASMLQSVFFHPSAGQYEPDGHPVHVDDELAPAMDDTVPWSQSVGNCDPGEQKAPMGQSAQSDFILPE